MLAYYKSQAQTINWCPCYLISDDSVIGYEVGEKSTKLKKEKYNSGFYFPFIYMKILALRIVPRTGLS